MMQRLLYISTARAPLTRSELDGILARSRENNARVGVTGLLVAGGRRFLQALEGADANVEETYARIRRDPRHFGVVELARTPIESRLFGEWAMGFQASSGFETVLPLTDIVAKMVEPIADPTVRAYFTGFAQVHQAA